MKNAARVHRIYDHRLKKLVRSTGTIKTALAAGVPRSTARGWLRSCGADVVSFPTTSETDVEELRRAVAVLEKRNRRLLAILRLVVALLKVSGCTLKDRRVADGARKELLLRVIERSRSVLGLRSSLRILRLSSSRYHSWRRESHCELDDVSSCPRSR